MAEPPRREPSQKRGWSPSSKLTLAVVGTLVVLVSIPRLRGFAVQANQVDARETTAYLGEMLATSAFELSGPRLAGLVVEPTSKRALADLEWIEEGRLLRRHGYLFELVPASGEVLVRAWPWRARRTGGAVFAFLAPDQLWGHPNGDGIWSGPGTAPPSPSPEGGWCRLR